MNLNNTSKSIFAVLTLAAPAAHAQEAGAGMREMINDPLVWGFGVAVFFMLIALVALNKALNTVRDVTLKSMASTETETPASK